MKHFPHFYMPYPSQECKTNLLIISLYQPSIIQHMNTFYSPPTVKSPSVKFSYSSPPHQKVNIFSPYHPQLAHLQSLTALRPVANINYSPRFHERQKDSKDNWMSSSQKWKRMEKQNLILECKKSVSQSVIIHKKKQEDNRQYAQPSFSLSDLANRIKNSQFSTSSSMISQKNRNNQHINQKVQSSTVFKQNFIQNENSATVYNFSKVKPKQRKIEAKVSNAKIEDFIVGQMIGKGGVGRVFLAKHRKTGFYFALKIIKKTEVKDIDQLAFSIKCHFLLNHPNLAQLYACFSDQECIYLIMQICIDGNLARYKKKIKNDEEKQYVVMGISKGIQYMHSECLRHGDLKLQNILINHGFPKITDFDCVVNGRHKSFKQLRRKSKLWGSPAYFSPEMMRQNTFTLNDDIWSLGVIMYELYCNAHPFNLKDTDDLTKIIDKGITPVPSCVNQSAKMLITQMLDKDQAKRATIDQILSHFE